MKTLSLTVFTSACLLCVQSHALDVTADAVLSSEYESNSGQTSVDEESAWNIQPGANIEVTHVEGQIQADLSYQARRQFYQDDEFDDATYVTGRGAVNWGILGDVWNVYADNQRTRTTIDNRRENTPDNQQVVDGTTYGTNLAIPVGRHRLIFQGEQSRTSLNEVGNDSDTQSLVAGYEIPIGSTRQLTLNYQSTETEFDDLETGDYDSKTSSISLATQSRTLQINANVGHTTTELDNSSDEIDGVTGGLDILWILGEQSTIQFNAARDITDNINSRRQSFFDEENQPDLSEEFSVGGQIFESTQFTLIGTTVLGTNQVSFSANKSARDFESVDTDESRYSFVGRLNRRLSRESGIEILAEYAKSIFADAPHDDSYRFEVSYDRQLTRRLSLDVQTAYREQTSRSVFREFDGWSVGVTFRYTILEGSPDGGGGTGTRFNNFGSRI